MRALIAREDGVAMVVTMGVIMTLLLLTAGVAELSVQLTKSSGGDRDSKRALAAANAGLRTATYRLSATGATDTQCFTTVAIAAAGCPAQATGDLGNGSSYSYYVSPVLGAGSSCSGPAVAGTKTVAQRCATSVGTVNGRTRRVQARIVAYPPSLRFPVNGILGLSGIKSSAAGSTFTGDLGANGNITLSGNPTTVTGTIQPGTASTTYTGPAASGGTAPVQSQPFQAVSDAAAFANAQANNDNALLSPLPTNATLSGYQLGATGPVASSASPWIWQSGNYYFCNISFTNPVYIRLAPNAKVHIFIDSPDRTNSPCPAKTGNINITQGLSLDNPSHDPLNLQIEVYGNHTCTTPACNAGNTSNSTCVCFTNTVNNTTIPLYGTIFAPWSVFSTTGATSIVGGIVANFASFTQKTTFSNGGLSGLTGGVSAYFQSAWRECRSTPSTTDPGSNC